MSTFISCCTELIVVVNKFVVDERLHKHQQQQPPSIPCLVLCLPFLESTADMSHHAYVCHSMQCTKLQIEISTFLSIYGRTGNADWGVCSISLAPVHPC